MEIEDKHGALSNISILVVEDDTVSRIFLRELLTSTGAKIEYMRNGYETSKYLAENGIPSIILLDLKLPDIDGIDLAKKILSDYPTANIIAQTAYAIQGMEEKCCTAGIKGFITKPIRKDELMHLLYQLV